MDRLNRRKFLRTASGLFVPALMLRSKADMILSGPVMRTMASGVTYLIEENGTGSGWTDTGTITWNYSGVFSPGVLVSGNATNTQKTFTGQTTVECYCKIQFTALPAGTTQSIFGFRDGSSPLAVLRVNNTGQVTCFANGSDSSACVTTMSTGTLYHLWVRYVSAGTCTVEFSTDGVRVGSGNSFQSRTGAAGTASIVRLSISDSGNYQADRILVLNGSIGNNP